MYEEEFQPEEGRGARLLRGLHVRSSAAVGVLVKWCKTTWRSSAILTWLGCGLLLILHFCVQKKYDMSDDQNVGLYFDTYENYFDLFIGHALCAISTASAAILQRKWLLHTYLLLTNIHRLKELRPARTTFDLALTLLLLNLSCLFQYLANLHFIVFQHTPRQSSTISNVPELSLISASFTAGILGMGYEVAKRSHVEVEHAESGEQEYFFIGGGPNFE